jgi:hypothetical protein
LPRLLAARRGADGESDERFRIVRPDGAVRWIHSRSFPVRDADGRVVRIVGISQDVTEATAAEQAKLSLIGELQTALAEIKTLRGMIPICAWCKSVRDDGGYWRSVEAYLEAHADVSVTHGMCPACYAQQLDNLAPASRE